MKKFILIYLFIFSITSCDILDVAPVSQISSENFYKSATDAEAALMGCYNMLTSFSYARDIPIVSSVISDETVATSGGNFTRHQGFSPNLNQGNIEQFWRISYSAIQRCLNVLENVPGINDPALDSDRIIGEALFIKGLSYLGLVRYFGGVPIVTQTTQPDRDLLLPRSEVSEVYEAIIQDLLEAERLLPVTNINRARATKGAARALLARVYLQRNGTGDVAAALAECEEVMADDQYQLVDAANYGSIFEPGQQDTRESIFEISYRPNLELAGSDQFFRELLPTNRYRVRPEPKMIAALEADPNDIRQFIAIDTYNGDPYVKKFFQGNIEEPQLQGPNIVVLRLADIMLMRAEALNELGRTAEAIPFLNEVRTRAQIAPTTAVSQEEVRSAIADERYVELCFEGLRWFDLIRTGKALETIPALTDPDRILWPIPVRDIDINPELVQNPSY